MLSRLLPLSVREAAYKRKFIENPEGENLFMGSYESFETAQANVPPGKAIGYDNAEEAKKLYSHQLYFYDYPGLFWLGRALGAGPRTRAGPVRRWRTRPARSHRCAARTAGCRRCRIRLRRSGSAG